MRFKLRKFILFLVLISIYHCEPDDGKSENDLDFASDKLFDPNNKQVYLNVSNSIAQSAEDNVDNSTIALTTVSWQVNASNASNNASLANKQTKDLTFAEGSVNRTTIDVNTSSNVPDVNITVENRNSSESGLKSLNRRSVDKVSQYSGYWSFDGKYKNCSEPKRNKTIDQDNGMLTPLYKCQQFSDKDLLRMFSKQIESTNGFEGVFGYFQDGKFSLCNESSCGVSSCGEPHLYDHPNRPDIKYIPFDIKYDPKCKYFDNSPGQRYDFKGGTAEWKTNSDTKAIGTSYTAIMSFTFIWLVNTFN